MKLIDKSALVAEIERRIKRFREEKDSVSIVKTNTYKGILSFIDTLEVKYLQEEPKPKKCMFTLEEFTDEDRKVLCEDCEEDCEYAKKYISEDYANELIDKWYKYASWRNSKHEGVLNAYGDFIERDDLVEMVTHIIKWYNEYGKGNQL